MEIIDNNTRKMVDVINNIMPSAQYLYFRTGYFFFSGYKEIYKNLKDKHVKILVGKDIERAVTGIVSELNYPNLSSKSKTKIRNDYYQSLVNTFRDVNEVDNRETVEAYDVFIKKILNGTLEIRKTLEPDHSKVYVFENSSIHNQNGEYLGAVIKGSSNLTFSGLAGQSEDNEIHKDNDYFKIYKNKFSELWDTSIPLIDKESYPDFKQKVLSKVWISQLPKPYSVYIRVLSEYFSLTDKQNILTPARVSNKIDLKYQIDAIKDSLNIISKHNGVIVADVVGLGKSIIASCVARNLNLKTIIISPPHLIEDWENYRYEFGFNAKVYGSGSVEKAIEENADMEKRLIIVDEAHKFRNEEKSFYANLHRLCRGNKVILLTATPFNNDPKDIFALVKLFQIPAKSTIQTIDNLSLRFRELIKQYNQIKKMKKENSPSEVINAEIAKLALHMKDLLGPLLIRRSRLDLEKIRVYKRDLEMQGIKFPKIQPPQTIKYEFGELDEMYMKTLELIAPEDMAKGFKGARYNIITYFKNPEDLVELARKLNIELNLVKNSQVNLAKFMKRLLVHRFESSIDAFRKTLDNLISSSEKIERWYSKGKVPIYKKGDLPDVEDFYYDNDGDETLEKVNDMFEEYEEKGLELIDTSKLDDKFILDLRLDIELLKRIRKIWEHFDPIKDPKIKRIKDEIISCLDKIPDRKLVIFSSYSDTVNYLYGQLKNDFKIFKYSGEDSSQRNREIIRSNFDAGNIKQSNEYQILIATDAISEGYNLHRAGVIFNYDIPYNPTRVIQRVGRINRINKKVYDNLYIYNFFPSPKGEEEIGIQRISTLKIDVIKALLGDDTKYLSVDEIIKSYNQILKDELDNLEESSWDAKYKDLIFSLRQSDDLKTSGDIPVRTKIRRTAGKEGKGVLVFGKKGEDYAFKLGISDKELIPITAYEAIRLFEAEEDEISQIVTQEFYGIYENAKQNLFIRKTEVPKDKGLRDAIEKVKYLKENIPTHKEYFEDLEYVMRELGALPAKYAKSIRGISKEKLKEGVESLIKEVPHDYLVKMMDEADSVGEGAESLILAEEL